MTSLSNSLAPFPHVWDSTMVATGRSCAHKLFRQYFEHWKVKKDSDHLVAGKAFAAGVEVARRLYYGEQRPINECVGMALRQAMIEFGDFEPEDKTSIKDCEHILGALIFYFDQYPLGFDRAEPVMFGGNRLGVEFSFSLPLPIAHPITGDPLLYTGRSDMVARAYGAIFPYDEKTASQLGPSWGAKWDMRSQFTGYVWALREHGVRARGVVVRGITISKSATGGKGQGFDCAQAITYRADWEIQRWLDTLCENLEDWITQWKRGRFRMSLDHACDEFGGCTFTRVCKSKTPEHWLPVFFEKRVWDPLAREQVSLQDWESRWKQGEKA